MFAFLRSPLTQPNELWKRPSATTIGRHADAGVLPLSRPVADRGGYFPPHLRSSEAFLAQRSSAGAAPRRLGRASGQPRGGEVPRVRLAAPRAVLAPGGVG